MFVGPSLEFYPDQNESIGLIGVRKTYSKPLKRDFVMLDSFETINQLGTDRTKDVKNTVDLYGMRWTTGKDYMENIPLGSAGGGNYWYLNKTGQIIARPKMK